MSVAELVREPEDEAAEARAAAGKAGKKASARKKPAGKDARDGGLRTRAGEAPQQGTWKDVMPDG